MPVDIALPVPTALPVQSTTSGNRVGLLRNRSRQARVVESAIHAGLVSAGYYVHVSRPPRSGKVDACVRELSHADVAMIQHDGDSRLLEIVRSLRVPVILVLHSIPSHPTVREEDDVVALCKGAELVVVMSVAARHVLTSRYAVDDAKVVVLPWGSSNAACAAAVRRADDPAIACVGRLAPEMGAECLIDAIALLNSQGLPLSCTIASDRLADAEYAKGLASRATRAGVAHLVTIDATGKAAFDSATFAVLPYESCEVLVSPSLVDALAAGRPVVATTFRHAVELLRDGAGILVPPRNPLALAEALRVVASDRDVMRAMTTRARLLAPSMTWRSAQRGFAAACARLVVDDVRMAA